MRILVLSDLYPPYYIGGHEIRCKIIADGLSEKGHEVHILTSTYGINGQSKDKNIYRLLYFIDWRGSKKRYMQIKNALLARLNYLITNKLIKQLRPDIIYAGKISGISILASKAIQSVNSPIVHHLGNYFPAELVEMCVLEKNPLKRLLRKIIYGFNDIDDFDFKHILVVSEAVKKRYVEAGFVADNISIIPPRGIPSVLIRKEYNRNIKLHDEQTKLLYVGRLSKEKGIDTALKTVEYLTNKSEMQNLTLDIIGDGDEQYVKELHIITEKLGIENRVKFIGELQYEDVLKEYDNYYMLLVPSLWEEPFGVIILEAMSQGLPVIASKVGGIPDILENEKTGLLVPPGDSLKMAEAVKKLVDNPSLHETISRNGIKRVQEEYTNELIIEKIENYMFSVFNESNRNPKP